MPGEEALFKMICKKFVEAIGENRLQPVANLNVSKSVSVLNIVVKTRKKKMFKKKVVYKPRRIKFDEVLKGASDIQIEIQKEPVFQYETPDDAWTVRGYAGLKAFHMLKSSMTLKVCNAISFDTGEIVSKDVNKRELLQALQNRLIDISDPQISQIRKANKNCVLCVITKVICLEKDLDINRTSTLDLDVEQTGNFDTPDGKTMVGASISAGRSNRAKQKVKIYGGTPLAYEICELHIDENTGKFELLTEPDLSGGFFSNDTDVIECMENHSDSSHEAYICKMETTMNDFSGDEMSLVRDVMTAFMSSSYDLEVICSLLNQATDGQDGEDVNGPSSDTTDTEKDTSQTGSDIQGTVASEETIYQASSSNRKDAAEHIWCVDDIDSLTEKPEDYLKLLQLMEWKITAETRLMTLFMACSKICFNKSCFSDDAIPGPDGSLVPPEDTTKIEVLEQIFESLRDLHKRYPENIQAVMNVSSESHGYLFEMYRQSLTSEREQMESTMLELVEHLEKLNKEDESRSVLNVCEKLEEEPDTRFCFYCVLLGCQNIIMK